MKLEKVINKLAEETSRSLTFCMHLLNQYAVPVAQFTISLIYGVYIRFTFTNFVSIIILVVKQSQIRINITVTP